MTDEQKEFSRRRFLKGLAAAGAGVAAAATFPNLDTAAAAAPEGTAAAAVALPEGGSAHYHQMGPPYSVPDTQQWVMTIDLAKCNGCGDCVVACNEFHRIPPGQEWIKIYRLQDNPDGAPYWFPRVCMQCDSAPCVKVCPVDATYKREDGIVMLDQDRCIGCRFCIAACPYGARYFNWSDSPETPAQKAEPYNIEMNTPHRRGVAEKCLFCPSNIRQGKLPACAAACPMNALYFGDRNEDAVTNRVGETLKLSEVAVQGAYRFQEELGTEPRVYYLPPRNRIYAPPAAGAGSGERGA